MGASLSELILALGFIFGGSLGLPMGMPPGPEDPLMFKIAPENCIFYATWTGVGDIDTAANPTEAWMGQPEIQNMVAKLRKAYRGMIRQEALDPGANELAGLLLEVAEIAAIHPTAFYLSNLQINDGEPIFEGAAMIGLGKETDRIEQALETFDAALAEVAEEEGGMKKADVDGQVVYQLRLPETQTELSFGINGKYFLIGFGTDALQQLAANSRTDAPSWLTESRERLPVARFSSMSFIDSQRAMDLLPNEVQGGRDPFQRVLDLVIAQDVRSVAWVSGVDQKGFLTRCSVKTNANLTGILAAFDQAPIPRSQLKQIPVDAALTIATRLSTTEILNLVTDIAKRTEQEDTLENTLNEFQNFTGMSLRDEFILTLGDYVYFYLKVKPQMPFGEWIGSIQIKDEMSFPAIFETINDRIREAIEEGNFPFEFSEKTMEGNEFYSVGRAGFGAWSRMTWGLIDDQWYFADGDEGIAKHLKGLPIENRLSNHETIKQYYEFGDKQGFGGPIAIAGLNLAPILKAVWPFFEPVRQQQGPISNGFDFAFSDIPDLDVLTRNLQPGLSAVFRTEDGFQILQRQTYPGSSLGVTIVAAAAIGMPYIATKYESEERAQTQNNLRQLALAAHNFESAYMRFPAAYTTNEQGQALLSWRVLILPFLGEVALYKQFHLNEPWDSEHNRTLIPLMPAVFQHPKQELAVGKTSYLAVVGEKAIFTAPAEDGHTHPAGKTGFGQITDGSSNTAMIVEVNADHAVTWTKPDVESIDAKQLLKWIVGIRPDNRFNIALGDGSVRLVGPIDAETLQNFLTIDDGNIVELPK